MKTEIHSFNHQIFILIVSYFMMMRHEKSEPKRDEENESGAAVNYYVYGW